MTISKSRKLQVPEGVLKSIRKIFEKQGCSPKEVERGVKAVLATYNNLYKAMAKAKRAELKASKKIAVKKSKMKATKKKKK